MSLLKTESYSRGLAFSTALNFTARLMAFLNSVTIAAYFGTSASTDVYFYTAGSVMLISGLITGFSQSILIPESMRIRERFGQAESIRFINFFLYLFIIMSLLIASAMYVRPVRLLTLFSGFDSRVLANHKDIILYAIPLIPLTAIVTFLTDVLTSYKYFTLPMIAGMINSLFSMCFIAAFHNSMAVHSILAGLILANTINFVLLAAILSCRCSWNFLSIGRQKISSSTIKDIFFSQAGNIMTTLAAWIPLYLLSGLGQGVIATLNYGRMAAEIPTQFISRQFSSVAGIKLNELNARGESSEFSSTFIRTVRFLVFILVPITGMIWLFSNEIITILFARGAFDASSVSASAGFLRLFSLSLALAGIDTIAARVYMAARKIRQSFLYQIIMNSISIILLYSLIKPLGQSSFPISVFLSYLVALFAQWYYMRRVIPDVDYAGIIPYFFIVAAINIVTAALCFAAIKLIHTDYTVIKVAAGCLTYTIIVVSVNSILGINRDFNKLSVSAIKMIFRR